MESVEKNILIIENKQVKTKDELKSLIEKTIEEQGIEYNLNLIDTSLIANISELFMNSEFNDNVSLWGVSKS